MESETGSYNQPITPPEPTETVIVAPVVVPIVEPLPEVLAEEENGEIDELQVAIQKVSEDTSWLRQQLTQMGENQNQGRDQISSLREETRNLRESVVSSSSRPVTSSETVLVETPPGNEGEGQEDPETQAPAPKKRKIL